MADVTIYHNPRCGNSRGALEIIGADPALQRRENQKLRERAVARHELIPAWNGQAAPVANPAAV